MSNSDVKAYIGGEWLEGVGWTENHNPADVRDVIGRSVECDRGYVNRAVAAAKQALPAWKAVTPPKRGEIVFEARALMASRLEEIANVLSREEGKVLSEARGEVKKTLAILEFVAGEGRRFRGDVMPSELPNTFCYTVRQPLGVVGLITPWNFPVAIPAWKIAPALIAGNTMVLKPAEQTPLTAQLVVQIFIDAGVPAGVLNFVPGKGEIVGQALVDHQDVSAISFTGSNEVGMQLSHQAAKGHKKCQCEMGGKNPIVVFADADLELAATATVMGAFGSTGQRCTATSRAIVDAKVHDQFIELVVNKAKEIRVGDPRCEGTGMGPSVDRKQYDQVHRYIQLGKEQATLRLGGGKLQEGDLAHGYFTEPTIFVDVRPEMTIAQEEIFGPVLSVIKTDGFDEALDAANSVAFGLSSSVYTNDLNVAQRFVDRIETGITHVNSPTVGGEAQLPFGGIKETGVGARELGETAVEFYSELKTVYVDYTGKARKTNIY